MFSTTALFKGVQCPTGGDCSMINCIFSHEPIAPITQATASPVVSKASAEPPAKKRRVDGSNGDVAAVSKVESQPRTLRQPISPPPSSAIPRPALPEATSGVRKEIATEKPVLNPKTLSHTSAGHGDRARLLKLLHAEYVRLNGEVEKHNGEAFGDQTAGPQHVLPEDVLISRAVDHEAELMVKGGNLYRNLFKTRYQALKKMRWDLFILDASMANPHAFGDVVKEAVKLRVNPDLTGLNAKQELAVARALVISNMELMSPHDYVAHPPSDQEVREELGSAPWRFQCVQTGCRAELVISEFDPANTQQFQSGVCRYHLRRPTSEGNGRQHYVCCNAWQNGGEVVAGCQTAEHHLISLKNKASLAHYTNPFIETPRQSSPKLHPQSKCAVEAVVFDCEMGYTTLGNELLRLTAISWPDGELLVDVLVRPRGTVLDYMTEFSGVAAQDFDPTKRQERSLADLEIVDGAESARQRLCAYLQPETLLIGHAIENDLTATRLCHPTVIDTVLVFAHPRQLPRRPALRHLTKARLGFDIQTGNDGHSSKEDCIATGELVRVRIKQLAREMVQRRGWTLHPSGDIEGKAGSPDDVDSTMSQYRTDMLKKAGVKISDLQVNGQQRSGDKE